MNPIPLELPVKPSEAAALSDLIFQHTNNLPLTDELRNRLASRVGPLDFTSLVPHLGSLQKDPIHSSAFYVAVDGLQSRLPQPLLLHLALASSPASAIFPGSTLIGRMRPGGGREIVVNAIPFSGAAAANIRTFANQVDRAFLPRPQAGRTAITVAAGADPAAASAGFEAFRAMAKTRPGCAAGIAGDPWVASWAAIRSGWREGFTVEAPPLFTTQCVTAMKELVLASADNTKFVVNARAGETEPVGQIYDFIQSVKAEQNSWKYFDFELRLPGGKFEDLIKLTEQLKESGRTPQLIGMDLPATEDIDEISEQIATCASSARMLGATLSFDLSAALPDAGLLQQIGRSTAGRFHVKLGVNADAKFLKALPGGDVDPRSQLTQYLLWSMENLRT